MIKFDTSKLYVRPAVVWMLTGLIALALLGKFYLFPSDRPHFHVGDSAHVTIEMDDQCYFAYVDALGDEWRAEVADKMDMQLGQKYEGKLIVTSLRTESRGADSAEVVLDNGEKIYFSGKSPNSFWTVPCPIRAAG